MKITRLSIPAQLLMLLCIPLNGAPNVLMIAFDDLNDWVSPLGGHPQSVSPNFDRLAEMGTRFTNAHCQAPLCGPSRASIFTGLNPSTTGIYVHVKDEEIQQAHPSSAAATFLTHYFKQHGYSTMGAGKLLHNGAGADFLDDYGGYHRVGPGAPGKVHFAPSGTNTDWGAFPKSDLLMPDYHVASYAVDKLAQEHDQPFFLAIGFNRPHVPWYVPQKWFDMIDLESVRIPPYLKDDMADVPAISRAIHNMEPMPKVEWLVETGQWKPMVQAYLACVRFVDHQLGRVLDALEQSPHAGNTLIVLWSDHGYHLGEKDIVSKMSLYEESSRVPLIFAGPGIQPNAVCREPVGLIDMYPTLVELAGLPENPRNEGNSLGSLLRDADAGWGHAALTFWGKDNKAVRTGRYRYIRYEDGSEELYDHSKDPNEWHNLATSPDTRAIREELARYIPGDQQPMSHFCSFPFNDYWREKTQQAKRSAK